MKLTTTELQKARTLAAINNIRLGKAINLVKKRITRLSTRPMYIGSAKKAESYYIL
jgi:hypothetical protein